MCRFEELIRKTAERLRRQGLFRADGQYVVAVSGGADSTMLLYIMDHLRRTDGFSIVAATVDHGLRPEAEQDVERVRLQARLLHIPLVICRVGTGRWRDHSGSPESRARYLRHRFLGAVQKAYGADGIVTGHNRTDHVETVLMNIHRGTGIRGMAGLLGSGQVLRPLLSLGRDQIREALSTADIPFREDPSNLDTRMLRNRVRRHMTGPLRTVFGDTYEQAWIRLSTSLRDSGRAMETLLMDRFGPSMQCMHGALRILRDAFPFYSRELQHELVLWLTEQVTGSTFRMNRSVVEQTARFLQKNGYGKFQPFRDDSLTIARSGKWMSFMTSLRGREGLTVPGEGAFPLWFGSLFVGSGAMPDGAGPIRWIDVRESPFPWCLEPVREGDVFQMDGTSVDAVKHLKKAGVGAFERAYEPVLKSGGTVLLAPDLEQAGSASAPVADGSIPVYMDRPMGYNPRRLQNPDPVGSDYPKEARER